MYLGEIDKVSERKQDIFLTLVDHDANVYGHIAWIAVNFRRLSESSFLCDVMGKHVEDPALTSTFS